MIKKSFIIIVFGLLCLMGYPNLSDAALGSIISNTHTHTNVLKLKPTSLEGSYQLASVCFLGVGDCPQGGFEKGDEDYSVDTAKQCMNEGYIKNNCNSAQEADTLCPYNSSYVKGCKCKSSLISCSSPKIGVGPSCGGKYASCTCPSSVSLTNPNDRCTQYCDGICIAKTCSPNASESGCQYGTQSCSNGCGGTRSCCKPCYPYSSETGCQYGTYSCSNGCGGTRTCCASCSPSGNETGCRYGTYTCSNGCGGTRTCCSSCTPLSNETGCQYGTESCSNGCGGTRTCCKAKPACSPMGNETGCQYGTESCSNGCGGTRTCCKAKPACTPAANATGCKYGTKSCSDGCGGTRTCCKGACESYSCPEWASCSETTSGPVCTCQSGFKPKPEGGRCVCRLESSYFKCAYTAVLKEDVYSYCGGSFQIMGQSPCAYCIKCR